ncbi:hypothetical protein SBF1_2630004 [Candidatus Desulfosporosinus infrequens]|uniref:Uncharacterized protein n=1 Tax=Candidatus Desulfosporosinus infrequens TaxID=2043169 RepID=A0A2U3KS94_9FIRM|nr:hypothetical protein SBF1_2630004 [Candidatus Desulfosporosinus infrequens]
MANKGTRLGVLTDRGEVQELEIYRDNPLSRCGTLKVWVEPDMLDPNPLILHVDVVCERYHDLGR